MALESRTCPNCGVQIEFPSGAATTTCKFCSSTLRLTPQAVADTSSHETRSLDEKTDPYRNLADMDRIKQLLRDGQRMQAIRLYMEQTGASLKEAQAAVDGTAFEAGASILRTLQGPYAIDLERIQELLARGNKLEAIKVLRAQTNLGLKEAKDAVEVIERGGLPNLAHDQRVVSKRAFSAVGSLGCLGALAALAALIAVCSVLMALLGQVMFRAWGPYDQALTLVRNSPEVSEALGAPLNGGLFIFGGISSDDRSSDARLETPIFGSRRSGSLRVSGTWTKKNGWDLSVWVLYDVDGEEQTIYLTGKQK